MHLEKELRRGSVAFPLEKQKRGTLCCLLFDAVVASQCKRSAWCHSCPPPYNPSLKHKFICRREQWMHASWKANEAQTCLTKQSAKVTGGVVKASSFVRLNNNSHQVTSLTVFFGFTWQVFKVTLHGWVCSHWDAAYLALDSKCRDDRTPKVHAKVLLCCFAAWTLSVVNVVDDTSTNWKMIHPWLLHIGRKNSPASAATDSNSTI